MRRFFLASVSTLLSAAPALAAGGGSMPYSPWLQQFRMSMTGEVPLILGIVSMGGAVFGWIQSGDMVGLGHYAVRIAMAAAFALGAATVLVNMAGAGGAVFAEHGAMMPWLHAGFSAGGGM